MSDSVLVLVPVPAGWESLIDVDVEVERLLCSSAYLSGVHEVVRRLPA